MGSFATTCCNDGRKAGVQTTVLQRRLQRRRCNDDCNDGCKASVATATTAERAFWAELVEVLPRRAVRMQSGGGSMFSRGVVK